MPAGAGTLKRNLRCCLLWSWLTLYATAALAGVVPAGPLPQLADGEGFLVVQVDTDTPVFNLHLNRHGSPLGSEQLVDIAPGRSTHVLKLAAGSYQWSRIDAQVAYFLGRAIGRDQLGPRARDRFDIADLPSAAPFRVEAGRISYAGDLHLRFHRATIHLTMPNRGEQVMRELAQLHRWLGQPAFAWVGAIGDRYPQWRADLPEAAPVAAEACPEMQALPQGRPSTLDLFRPDEVQSMSLSPEGDLVLELAMRRGHQEINVIEPASGDVVSLFRGVDSVIDARWAGARRVAYQLRGSDGGTGVIIADLREGPLARQTPVTRDFQVDGWVIDPLPRVDDALLFGAFRSGHDDPLQVFRVDLGRKTIDAAQFEPRKRIDKGVDADRAWIADAQGRLRLAQVEVDGRHELLYSPGGRADFVPLPRADTDRDIVPLALDQEGRILALSNHGRDQMDLVRLDPAAPGAVSTVHSIPGIDLVSVVRSNASGAVVGVRYFESGQSRTHFFNPVVQSWQASVARAFPNHQVELTEVDEVARRAIVVVSSDIKPPVHYLLEVASGRVEELADSAPWLDGNTFVQRNVSTVTADDDVSIQVLLAKPARGDRHPLLVMPHGGPFYILDVLGFDREVQYWATRGFAVVQINFRGSFGFGAQHLLDGLGGFGGRIEDDIEAAVEAVLAANGDLDGERICALGSSYGGYSALMLAIRDPGRFKCAVALAAPTDLSLLFTSSDWSASPDSRETMARWIGDPESAQMSAVSPLYRVAEISVPVLLIHGEDDRRVDYEHALRLSHALSAHGKPHRLLRIDDMGHGPKTIGQQACMLGSAEIFLRQQLGIAPAPETIATASPSDEQLLVE